MPTKILKTQIHSTSGQVKQCKLEKKGKKIIIAADWSNISSAEGLGKPITLTAFAHVKLHISYPSLDNMYTLQPTH